MASESPAFQLRASIVPGVGPVGGEVRLVSPSEAPESAAAFLNRVLPQRPLGIMSRFSLGAAQLANAFGCEVPEWAHKIWVYTRHGADDTLLGLEADFDNVDSGLLDARFGTRQETETELTWSFTLDDMLDLINHKVVSSGQLRLEVRADLTTATPGFGWVSTLADRLLGLADTRVHLRPSGLWQRIWTWRAANHNDLLVRWVEVAPIIREVYPEAFGFGFDLSMGGSMWSLGEPEAICLQQEQFWRDARRRSQGRGA